MTVNF